MSRKALIPLLTAYLLASQVATQASRPADEYVARVGPGRITRAEYDAYLAAAALKEAKLPNELGPRHRRHLFVTLIEDELLFQAALQAGIHEDLPMRDEIVAVFRQRETSAKVDRASITDAEIQAFYNQNLALFSERARVRVRMLSFASDTPEAELQAQIRKARAKPSSLEAPWFELSWRLPGETLIDAIDAIKTEKVFQLQKGQVSEPIRDSGGNTYLFWVIEREDGKPRPLAAVRSEIVERIHAGRCARLEDQLLTLLRAADPGRRDADALFYSAAIEQHVERDPELRRKIIAAYLKQRRIDRSKAITSLRGQFEIEVLLREP